MVGNVGPVRFRRFLSKRLSVSQMILVIGGLVFSFNLAVEGNLLPAAVVLVVAAALIYGAVLVTRIRLPARTVRIEETTVLTHSIEAVWNLVNPPDLAPLLTPGLALGYRVPGTPSGLGERQAFERLNGTTVILEVIQYEPNRLAVTRQVSPALVNGIRTFDAVEPKDDGCRYSVAFELDVKAGARLRPEFERKLRCAVTARFSRVRAILDSGEPIVAPTRDATPPVDPVS